MGCKEGAPVTSRAETVGKVLERQSDQAVGSARPGAEMVPIRGGAFRMGTAEGMASERPVHEVTVDTFEIDLTEVTVAAYRRCVAAGHCRPTPQASGCSISFLESGDHPINCVAWFDADGYCKSIGKRLPSEEEWEYAARGRAGRIYPWGASPPVEERACWKRWDKREATCPVGSHRAGDSPEGVHDLAGNVWEWTASAWSTDYESSPDSRTRVTRGGGWGDSLPANLRSASRGHRPPEYRSDTIGFRCAR